MAGEPEIAGKDRSRPRAADRLSKTAKRLFYQRGIRAVGVEEIVAQAGVTKPSLYRSFASKDDLIARCLQERFDRTMAWWDALEAQLPDDPLAQLQTLVGAVAEEANAPLYRGCAVTNAAVEFPDACHPAHRIAQQYKNAVHGRLLRLVRRLPIDEPELLTNGLILLVEGARSSRHTSGTLGPSASMMPVATMLLDHFLSRHAD